MDFLEVELLFVNSPEYALFFWWVCIPLVFKVKVSRY